MSNWIALSRTQHADKYFWPRQGYGFTATQSVVPILLAELGKLLPHHALGFIPQGEDYQPVALTGLGDGRNLYVAPNGKWLGSYVPSSLRGYPFSLAKDDNDQPILAIEQNSLTEEPAAQPLLTEDGKLSEKVQQTLDFLVQCDRNRQVTQAGSQALADAGVIEPWPLQVERGEGLEPLKVQGLYRVNEKALNELETATFAGLRQNGALALAYAQLFSMSQLSQLAERAKFHAQHQASQPAADNLDELFEGDDDFTFDFDR